MINIGVFDSGVGGLWILKHLQDKLPAYNYVYFGDQVHVPYGPRSMGQIKSFSVGIVKFLISKKCKVIVIACNTASAASLKHLRIEFPHIFFVGMEPAIKPAVEITNIGKGDSLLIKLDGKIYYYKSNVELSEHETIHLGSGVTMPFSYKTYIVPESVIREAAASNIFLVKMYFLNNTFIEAKCSSVTLQESQEKAKKHGLSITQHDVDVGNKYTAINGFRYFVEMMDSTSW